MNRLLIVDDEAKIREVIREYAEVSDFETDEAENGEEAIKLVKEKDYDIIIMDIMMPIMDGFTATKEIRNIKNVPIILLSARGEEYDKLLGFQLGIDDYVVKPFSPKELMARINAVITRHRIIAENNRNQETIVYKEVGEKENTLKFDGLVIDKLGRQVLVDGDKIEITPKEYELLVYIAENKNKAMSREELLEKIWGYTSSGDDRTIDTHIKNLRNHIGQYREFIVTMRGIGYKFVYEKF